MNDNRVHCEDLPDGQWNLPFWERSEPLEIPRLPDRRARLAFGRLTRTGNHHLFDERSLVVIIDSALRGDVLEGKRLRTVQVLDENSSHP